MIESPKAEEPQVNYGVDHAGDAVSTESGSDRVSIHAMVEFARTSNPVATAPGTDLMTQVYLRTSA